MDAVIEDYYQIIEELDRDLEREENYHRLREALKKWSKRSGSAKAKQMELKIKEAMRIFENEDLYEEYHYKLIAKYKEHLADIVRIASINGKLPPSKKDYVIRRGVKVLSIKAQDVEDLLEQVLEEEGIILAEPDTIRTREQWLTLVKEKSIQLLQDAEMRIKKSSLFQNFEGSYRILVGLTGSAIFLLIVHVTVGAIAGFWILIATAGLYFWLKRRW